MAAAPQQTSSAPAEPAPVRPRLFSVWLGGVGAAAAQRAPAGQSSPGRGLAQALRMLVGVPDYERYVAHLRSTHPEQQPMDYEAFFRNRQEARYGGAGRVGCC